ncbi:piggyBac transposable element-derived protein 4-like [Hyposmocoma kahamanoa]|uniref:piggyBac transposable element-derived protein 4-like n=1 Tax=Hyposmocoma kahamanoa TaxID=1477025 RepID=UPI000E6D7135|nr:piggyBac transposable element-derived protein 4-like [Hyposmocoma kahamanoa]
MGFRRYNRSEAAKFGIKTFELCESATGYLWSFLVYTGKQSSFDLGPEIAKSTAVVLKLIEPLLNKGYRLFMDNWFNSPILARFLKRNGTDCVGTLRSSRVNVPKLVTHAPLQQGQLVARHSGDVCVLSWLDKKRITMISTCHGSATGLPNVSSRPPSRPEPFKPQAVLDYNRSMGGVDLKDQMLEPYLLERKRCAKWYVKLFKRLLNASIHNSRILLESSLKARQDNLQFRLELVHTILSLHHSRIPKSRRVESSHRRSLFPQVLHTHWPVRLQQSDTDQTRNRQGRKRCVVCLQEGRKMQKTPFKCDTCDVPLCVENCFKMYHTSRSYHTSSSM